MVIDIDRALEQRQQRREGLREAPRGSGAPCIIAKLWLDDGPVMLPSRVAIGDDLTMETLRK